MEVSQAILDSLDTTGRTVQTMDVRQATDDSYIVRIKWEEEEEFFGYYLDPSILS